MGLSLYINCIYRDYLVLMGRPYVFSHGWFVKQTASSKADAADCAPLFP